MAKTVGALKVKLTANTRGFTRGMKRAQASTKGFQTHIGKLATKLVGIGAVIAGVGFAFRGMSRLAAEAVLSIDRLAKTASKLGANIQLLARFQFAAKIAGVEVRTFDMALQRFTRRLSEAAIGTGEALGALEELRTKGLMPLSRLVGLGPTRALLEIADAFQNVDNQADRVRLSFKLFDSEGVALVNLLQLGRKEIEKLGRAADRFGTVVSDKLAKSMENLNDQTTRAKEAWRGVGIEWAKIFGGTWDSFKETSGGALRQAIRLTRIQATAILATIDPLTSMEDKIERLAHLWLELKDATNVYTTELGKANKELEKMDPRARGTFAEFLERRTKQVTKAPALRDDLADRIRKVIRESRTPLEKFTEQLKGLQFWLAQGNLTTEQFAKAVTHLKGKFVSLFEEKVVERVKATVRELKSIAGFTPAFVAGSAAAGRATFAASRVTSQARFEQETAANTRRSVELLRSVDERLDRIAAIAERFPALRGIDIP